MKINRRKFVKLLTNITLISSGIFFFDFINKQIEKRKLRTKKILKNDFGNGIHLYEDVLIIKSQNEIKIFRANCTHLGCKVRQNGDGNLVCPCHGSKFDSNGKVLNGPAKSSLEKLEFKLDKSKNEIIIYA